jgi:hypothetical protein
MGVRRFSWWPGNKDARDRAGSNEGALRNGAAIASGKVNQAFSFDGMDDSILVAHSPSLDRNDHTIGAWINPGAQLDIRRIVQKERNISHFPNIEMSKT